MKKSTLAALLMSGLLAGCSDSSSTGSSSSTSKTYQWQMVHLESVDEVTANAGRCVIYADSTVETDESRTEEPEYQVITAYETDEDYNILYHNPDGSIAQTIEAGETNNGVWNIDINDVPDNGYVTLEEVTEELVSGTNRSFMFSVQKSLLDDMVLNVRQTDSGADCVTGNDYREDGAITKFVNVQQQDDDVYYQTSYDVDSIAGNTLASDIPVDYIENESRDILVTAFDDFTLVADSSATTETTTATPAERTNLLAWGFIDYSLLYDGVFEDGEFDLDDNGDVQYTGDGEDLTGSLDDDNLTEIEWDIDPADITTLNEITLDGDSGVIVIHDQTTYLWQPIYDNSDVSTVDHNLLDVAYEADEVDVWNSYFSGSVTLTDLATNAIDWDFNSFNSLSDEPSYIYLTNFDNVILDSLNNTIFTTVSTSCSNIDYIDNEGDTITGTPALCVDLSDTVDSAEFTYQRLHIRLTDTDDDNSTYQTIYSVANDEPVILESSEVDSSVLTDMRRIELNIMQTDDEDLNAIQYMMSENMDKDVLANGTSSDEFYVDLNGYIATKTEKEELYQAVLETNTTTIQSTYEP